MKPKTYFMPIFSRVFLVFICLFCSSSLFATTAVMLSDDDLIISSRAIVRAQVLAVESQFDENHERIYTYVTLHLQEVFKGPLSLSQEIVLRQPGGRVGDSIQYIYGAPEFTPGESLVLYLNTADDGALRVAHLFMGKFSIVRDEKTGQRFVQRLMGDVKTLSRNVERDGDREITNMMELEAYQQKIRRTLKVSASRVAEVEQLHSNQPLASIPREFKPTSQGRSVQPQFTFLGRGFRWFEADAKIPLKYYFNLKDAPPGTSETEFTNSLAAWTDVPTASITLQNSGPIVLCGFVTDGFNTISFGDCRKQIDDPFNCQGILAIGGVTNASTQTTVINGKTFFQILESDVVFNNNFNCFFTSTSKVAEVMTHEIGHSIGMGHSSESSAEPNPILKDATMYYKAHADGRGASLRQDDIDGVTFIYPLEGANAKPVINNFLPSSGPVGTQVTINGGNLGGTTSVSFNGAAATFSNVTAVSLVATVPQNATSGPITLVTPNGTATTVDAFIVTAPPTPAPTIISFSPSSGPPLTTVTISGRSFTGTTLVTFNDVPARYTVVSDTTITASVPNLATTGPIQVYVGNKVATSADDFIVTDKNPPPAPTLLGFSPTSGPVGTNVTVTGTNFTNVSSVAFNGTGANFTVNSSTEIVTQVPVNATTGPLSVTTATGTATSSTSFTVIPNNQPTITSFSPTSGAAGTTVILSGTNLTGATSVEFNGTKAQFSIVSDTNVITQVPANATTGPIRVTTPSGTATTSSSFTMRFVPLVTSVSPGSGRIGTLVTIFGTNLENASVQFGTVSAVVATNTVTQIQTFVPETLSPGNLLVVVTTPGGTTSFGFTVEKEPSPAISTLSPTKGRPGTAVIITGSNLKGATVRFGTVAAIVGSSVDVQIQTTVPANLPKGKTIITVTTSGGSVTASFKVK